MKLLIAKISIAAVAFASVCGYAQTRALVYTRNYVSTGKGYVHDNIAASVEAIRKLGEANGFAVDVSEDPAVFNDQNLAKYKTLIFSNSNNEAFTDEAQRAAFQRYIHGGGGFVGIHSASGSERQWPYFWSVLGGSFAAHPHMQTFTVQVADPDFRGMKDLPKTFTWNDECYFIKSLNPDIHPILVTDRTKIDGTEAMKLDVNAFPNPLPLAWYHSFDHGREFYLALGHKKEDYSNPMFLGILANGILWTMGPGGR